MSDCSPLPEGLYERLLDEELAELLGRHPEVAHTLARIDDESATHAYAQFVAQLLEQPLRMTRSKERLPLLNRLSRELT